ncbi:hypothetical protein UFOVP434_105 [uncultured Caudovirales phage]|uniref:Uncharacterized protein n=1 Tax=uncultured Caudovirales phage TaxID=2100421 RepID=A0A6J5MD81_9CAUD|nr:hypothetical protein UFOVP434_105 [uncultured Caudovirales phage]
MICPTTRKTEAITLAIPIFEGYKYIGRVNPKPGQYILTSYNELMLVTPEWIRSRSTNVFITYQKEVPAIKLVKRPIHELDPERDKTVLLFRDDTNKETGGIFTRFYGYSGQYYRSQMKCTSFTYTVEEIKQDFSYFISVEIGVICND